MSDTIAITQLAETGGEILSAGKSYTASLLEKLDESVPASETDWPIVFTLDVSEVKAIIILSDQDLLMEVNDGAGAGGSIPLVAHVPYIWTTDSYDDNLLAVDITGLFMTNATAVAARLRLWTVVDATPPA